MNTYRAEPAADVHALLLEHIAVSLNPRQGLAAGKRLSSLLASSGPARAREGKRGALLHDDDFTIVAKYQSEYAGLVQYCLPAQDVFGLAACTWSWNLAALDGLAAGHGAARPQDPRR
jgi:hypothetical protein